MDSGIDRESSNYILFAKCVTFDQLSLLNKFREKLRAKGEQKFSLEDMVQEIEGKLFELDEVETVFGIVKTGEEDGLLSRLDALCVDLEKKILSEAANPPNSVDQDIFSSAITYHDEEHLAASIKLFGEEEGATTKDENHVHDDLDDLNTVTDTKDNLVRMRDKLKELVKGLEAYKKRELKKEAEEVSTAIRSMGKVADKMDLLLGPLAEMEKHKELKIAENDSLTHRVRQLELENSNLLAALESAKAEFLAMEQQLKDAMEKAAETEDRNTMQTAKEPDNQALFELSHAAEEISGNRESVTLLEQIKILQATLLQSGGEDEGSKVNELKEQMEKLESALKEEQGKNENLAKQIQGLKRENQYLSSGKAEAESKIKFLEQASTSQVKAARKLSEETDRPKPPVRESIFGTSSKDALFQSSLNIRDSTINKFASTLVQSGFCKNKDYIGVAQKKKVQDELIKEQEKAVGADCYSDSIFLLDAKKNKRRALLIIANGRLIVLNAEIWRVIYKQNLDKLDRVSVLSTSPVFLCLHFTGKEDLIMESFRRTEIVAYLAGVVKDLGFPLFKIAIVSNVKIEAQVQSPQAKPIKNTGLVPQVSLKEVEAEKVQKNIQAPHLQEAIRNARKSGFMRKYHKGNMLKKDTYEEYFFILTEVGLIYFRKYEDIKSAGFMPILGGSVYPLGKDKIGKDYTLCVKTAQGEKVLQCYSQLEMEDWVKAISEVQNKAIGAKDTLREINKVLG